MRTSKDVYSTEHDINKHEERKARVWSATNIQNYLELGSELECKPSLVHLVDKYTRSVLESLSTNHTRAYAYKYQWLDFIKSKSLIILKRQKLGR